MALRKIVPGRAMSDGGVTNLSDQATYTQILEYLTAVTYPDGTPRERSSLIILAEPSGWRGCLSDKDNKRSLWKTADSVHGLLEAIEMALLEDDPTAWRQSYEAGKAAKKRA